MKKILALILISLFLTACADAPMADPLAAERSAIGAQSTLQVVEAGNRATAKAASAATADAAAVNAQYAAQADYIREQSRAYQLQIDGETTRAAQVAMYATLTAAPLATAYQATQAAPMVAATSTAVAALASIKESDARRAQNMEVIYPLGVLFFSLVAGFGVKALLEQRAEQKRMMASVRETKLGPVRWVYNEAMGQFLWELLNSAIAYRSQKSDFPAVPEISPGGITATSDLQPIEKKALRLLERMDDDAREIPGYREAGMSSYVWQEIIKAWRDANAARKDEDGEWVIDGVATDARDLRYKLETEQIHLSPTRSGSNGNG